MGTSAGPRIKRDGLVFGYDTNYGVADKKLPTRFYPGVPAVNCAPGVVPTTGISDGTWTTTEITDGSITPPRKGARVFKLVAGGTGNLYRQSSYYGGGGFSSNNPQNSLLLGRTSPSNFTTVGTNKYKYGFWVRGDSSNGASDTIQIDVADRGGSTRTVGTSTEWYFINADDSLGSNSSSYPYDFFDLYSLNQNMIIYISDFGIYRSSGTVDSLPTLQAFPQFIEYGQTRSYTQSLIDLTKTSTIDVSNVSFDSTGLPTFDGTDDYIQISLTGADLDSGCTIEGVLKRNSTPSAWRTFFNIKTSGANTPFFEFRSNSSSQHIYANYYNGTDYNTNTASLTTGDYGHAIATYDGNGNIKMYFNGELIHTKTSVPSFALGTSPRLTIGRAYSNDRYTDIEAPVVKIYDRALSADEVQQNYNAYRNRFNL